MARERALLVPLPGKGQVAEAIGMAGREAHYLVQQLVYLLVSLQLLVHRPALWMTKCRSQLADAGERKVNLAAPPSQMATYSMEYSA